MAELPRDKRARHRGTAITTSTIGGLAVTAGAGMQGMNVPEPITWPVLVVGIFVTGAGILWLAVAFFFPRDRRNERNYTCRPATAEDVPTLLTFAESHMPAVPMPPQEYLWGLLSVNPDLYYIVEGREDGENAKRMVGCFTILPLKQGAVKGLEDGDLQGSGIKEHHISKKRGAPKALYIGIVVGCDHWASGFTIKLLGREIDRMCRKHQINRLFARPVTDDGLKILKKRNFTNVLGGGPAEMNIVCQKLWDYKHHR